MVIGIGNSDSDSVSDVRRKLSKVGNKYISTKYKLFV